MRVHVGLTYSIQTGPLSKNSSLNFQKLVEESMLYISNVQRVNFTKKISEYPQSSVVQVGTAVTF